MKIKIIATPYMANDSGTAIMWCSPKEHDEVLEHIKTLGFEITHEEPAFLGLDHIWQNPPTEEKE